MNRIKLWPHGILIVLAFATVAAIAAALWMKYERSAEAKALPNAARIERVEGQVGVSQSLDTSNSQWVEAKANSPITVGDRIYTRENSRSQLAFTGRNFATVDANTALDVLDLSAQRTQVALRNGSALFDVGSPAELFEVATPCGAVDFEQPGMYQVAINEDGNAMATAYSGGAQVVGQGGAGRIEKGENLAIPCQSSSPAVLSRVDAGQAGTVIDNYYRSRYPRTYDGRYRSYYSYLDDPYYYDPSRRYNSYNYVSDYVPGVYDLDDYGDWQYVSDYGYCWHPRVDNGWAPYQSGYWTTDYPYGLTWVSNEPWGYAPYHYGRWTYSSNEWFWVPGSTSSYPTYSPALVAFLPLGDTSVGWVALGPSDPYAPRYYDSNWQPVYTSRNTVFVDRISNLSVPGAVAVVPVQQFTQVIDPRVISRVDPQTIARVRPVLDPLAVNPLRTAAFRTRDARPRFDMPQAVAQRVFNTPVVTSAAPVQPFRRDLARTLHVEPLADRARNQKLQISDQRGPAGQQRANNAAQPGNGAQPGPQPNIAAEQARERQMADLARQAARGDRNARQQMQDLRRQQVEQQRATQAGNAAQAQGERVRQQMPQQGQREVLRQQQQVQRDAARQQVITSQQLRHAAAPQQVQTQRQQRRQLEIQRAPTVRAAPQQQQVRPQAPAQRREQRPRQQYQPPAQPRVIAPQQTQMRQQPRPQQTAPRAAPQEMRQQRPAQAQPRPQPQAQPQAPAPQKQQAQPQPQEQKGGRKKPGK
jgi:FecR protein